MDNNINILEKDTWVSPFTIKIIENFLDERYYSFIKNIIETRNFIPATQGVGGRNIVQKEHKIRLDYTLNNQECATIDNHFLKKADCNCNLRERWRLLYYNGDTEEKGFRDAHTDWTTYSCHRRMSIIIGYSDPSEYEGGELYFRDKDIKYKIEKGAALVFDAKLVHEVLPVTKGKRYVLQAFLFDDSGYDLKREKNGKQHFSLLGNDLPPQSALPETKESNNDFLIYENKNAVHSRINSVNDCYIGNYKYMSDLRSFLEKNPEIHCFTWHKPDHLNKKWAGRAYGWNKRQVLEKKRLSNYTWPIEMKVISGVKNEIKQTNSDKATILETKEDSVESVNCLNVPVKNSVNDDNKYLTIVGTDGGPGNQIVGIKEAILISEVLNRNLIVPPILQHYVLNRLYRGTSEINPKYWNFNKIFTYKNDENYFKNLMENKELLKKEETVYYLRRQDIDKPLRMERILELKPTNKFMLHQRSFRNYNDFDELKAKSENTIILTDLYNNTAISNCFWNGCDTCELNPIFLDAYKEICKNLDFSDWIKEFGDNYIKEKFGDKDFIALHLRYPDYIYGNTDIKSINKLYNETDINNLVIEICNEKQIDRENVFIATSNKAKVKSSDLKDYHILYNDKNYDECESFIEQYIATKCKYFIYTGGIHAKPDHTHLRSTWSSFVIDYRNFKLGIDDETNIYLTKKFNNFEKKAEIKTLKFSRNE